MAGGAITSAGNATIDIVTGNVPSFNSPEDALLYVGKEALTGAATSFAGAKIAKFVGPALSRLGSSVGGWFKTSFQAYAKESIETIIINGKPITTTIDIGIKATKIYVTKALGSTLGSAGKGAVSTTMQPLKNFSGSLEDAATLARNQPYGPNTNIFRRLPNSPQDVQALANAQSGMGQHLTKLTLKDPRYIGWEKWHYSLGPKGGKSVIHYLRDPKTGFLTDFKFK